MTTNNDTHTGTLISDLQRAAQNVVDKWTEAISVPQICEPDFQDLSSAIFILDKVLQAEDDLERDRR